MEAEQAETLRIEMEKERLKKMEEDRQCHVFDLKKPTNEKDFQRTKNARETRRQKEAATRSCREQIATCPIARELACFEK